MEEQHILKCLKSSALRLGIQFFALGIIQAIIIGNSLIENSHLVNVDSRPGYPSPDLSFKPKPVLLNRDA